MSRKNKTNAEPPLQVLRGQTVDAMTEQLKASKAAKRSYPEEAAAQRQDALAKALEMHTNFTRQVAARGGRVDLSDLNFVQETAEKYLEACKYASVIPTMIGLAAALGTTRKTLYWFLAKHPNEPSARYIAAQQTAFAAVLEAMGLNRCASEAVSIFLLRNSGQGLVDRSEIEISPRTIEAEEGELSVEDLRKRYLIGEPDADFDGNEATYEVKRKRPNPRTSNFDFENGDD